MQSQKSLPSTFTLSKPNAQTAWNEGLVSPGASQEATWSWIFSLQRKRRVTARVTTATRTTPAAAGVLSRLPPLALKQVGQQPSQVFPFSFAFSLNPPPDINLSHQFHKTASFFVVLLFSLWKCGHLCRGPLLNLHFTSECKALNRIIAHLYCSTVVCVYIYIYIFFCPLNCKPI